MRADAHQDGGGDQVALVVGSRGIGRYRTSPAPTSCRPSYQPKDSLRHSILTRPHAGVCRKLTDCCVYTNAKCSAALIGLTVRLIAAPDQPHPRRAS